MTYISNQAPVATLDNIRTNLQSFINSMSAYKANLSEEQKRKGRSMGGGREGYARMISQIAANNVNSLPREHNPADLTARLNYDAKLEELRQTIMTLFEIVSETQMANSMDIMKLVDDFAQLLQISRNNNASLDLAMREADEWNRRFVNKNPDPDAGPTGDPA